MGGFMDSSFDLTYQKFRWHSERIFGMHGVQNHDPATAENGDSLTITNRSSKKASYLNVGFGINRFLILDLEPGDSHTVYTNHSMAPEWITGSAVLADGMEVRNSGINFFESAKKNNERLFRYCLTVNDTRLEINSIDVEGENLNPSRKTPRLEACGD